MPPKEIVNIVLLLHKGNIQRRYECLLLWKGIFESNRICTGVWWLVHFSGGHYEDYEKGFLGKIAGRSRPALLFGFMFRNDDGVHLWLVQRLLTIVLHVHNILNYTAGYRGYSWVCVILSSHLQVKLTMMVGLSSNFIYDKGITNGFSIVNIPYLCVYIATSTPFRIRISHMMLVLCQDFLCGIINQSCQSVAVCGFLKSLQIFSKIFNQNLYNFSNFNEDFILTVHGSKQRTACNTPLFTKKSVETVYIYMRKG